MSSNRWIVHAIRFLVLVLLLLIMNSPLLTIQPDPLNEKWKHLKKHITLKPKTYNKDLVQSLINECRSKGNYAIIGEINVLLCKISFEQGKWADLKIILDSTLALIPDIKSDSIKRHLYREYFDYRTKSLWHENEFQKADSLYLGIIDLMSGWPNLEKKDSDVVNVVKRYLFNSSVIKGDRTLALHYYNQLIKSDPCNIFTKKKFAEYHLMLKDTASAFRVYRSTIEDYVINRPDSLLNSSLFDFILAFSNAQLLEGDINGSLHTFDLLDIYSTDNEFNKYEKIFLKGKIYSALKKYKLANTYLNQYIKLSHKRWGKKKKESIEASLYLANNERKLGFPDKALLILHQALINSSLYFNSSDINNYPETYQILFKIEVVSILQAKAQCFAEIGLLPNAVKSNELAIEIIQDLQSSYQNDEEISYSNNQYKLVYEDQLEYLYSLSDRNQTGNNLIEKAQTVFERSKNSVLLKSFRNSNAMVFADIPDSLIQKETKLKNELTYLEKGLRNVDVIDNIKQSEKFITDIQKIKTKYNLLIEDFKLNYPKYFNLKYNNTFASIDDVKSQIRNSDKAVVQYFVGREYVYALVITEEGQQFRRLLASDLLNQKVDTLIKGMNLFSSNENKYFSSGQKEAYSRIAHELYKELILPLKTGLKNKKELVLIVDGKLGYIPFDVLLTSNVESDELDKYKFYPYLLKDYAISYNTSATLWKEMEQFNNSMDKIAWVGFAPEYSSTGNDAPVGLKNSVEEIGKIASEIRGSKYVGEDASKNNFIDVINKQSLVQFAGHCIINDNDADSSFLAFTNEGKNSETWKLSVNEIYGIHVNAKYLVLSACETGTGILKKGEGIMSLSRAFAYAGATSILSTFWKVDDKYSYALMSGLYKNLDKGLSKDQALRKAKLDFIAEGSNASAHPFNWGPFATLGNTQGIKIDKLPKDYTLYYILVPALLLVSYLVFKIYRKRTA